MYGLLEMWSKKGLKMDLGYDIQPIKSNIQIITKKQDKKKPPNKGGLICCSLRINIIRYCLLNNL